MILKGDLKMNEFIRNEEGQGMVEYGLILALVAVVVIAALTTLGTKVGGIFESVSGNLVSGNAS